MEKRLISYVYFFNRGEYYLCHEYGESLWLDSGRKEVLKGLIQAAVCLYHLQGGNVKGGLSMWLRAKGYLAPSFPDYEGLSLEALVRDIDAVFARVPTEWRGRIVPAQSVEALGLPAVTIQCKDLEVLRALPSWEPDPLEDEG